MAEKRSWNGGKFISEPYILQNYQEIITPWLNRKCETKTGMNKLHGQTKDVLRFFDGQEGRLINSAVLVNGKGGGMGRERRIVRCEKRD